jgi:galactose mutarotase-like enzyme
VIVLRSHELLAVLDPRHGGELLDVVHLQTGRRVLGRPPFATAPPSSGDLSEPAWTASYRGGWQLVAPNAGAACRVGDVDHGFHGSASSSPWEVVSVDASVATLTWHGHGLELTRVVELAGASIHVRVVARALEPAPLVVLEHIALGVELLDPEVEIDLPAGLAYELSETAGPPRPPRDAPRWPDVLLLDGSLERADRWRLEQPRSRLFAVAELPEGRARVRNPTTGTTVELDWETTWLRHLWVWHEAREYGGPWRGMTELLAIEPTSVPHPLGLATAIEHGQALELGQGETADYELRFTVTTT